MSDALLARLAEAAGILPAYWDLTGEQRACTPETARLLLRAMNVPVDTAGDMEDALRALTAPVVLPPAVVLRRGAPLRLSFSGQAQWMLRTEFGDILEGRADGGLVLPEDIADGYHHLTLDAGTVQAESRIIVAPPACYRPPALDRRRWGVACHLYSLRSRGDWGIGSFTDLKDLAEMTAAAGGATVAINPLHALFPERPDLCSPYWPSSRRFLDPIYLDLGAIPELKDCEEAREILRDPRLPERIAAAKSSAQVDYKAVSRLKYDLLRPLVRRWEAQAWPELDAFVAAGGEDLHRFAVFSALSAHFGGKAWPHWPEGFRDPTSGQVERWAAAHRRDIRVHLLLQWLAERQLAAAADTPLEIGLLRDLAVGISPDGADAWANQMLYPAGTRFGAPPDMFTADGQDWGLPPPNPRALAAAAYRPFIAAMHANMAHAGALRIDHVMSLDRLFWIPAGAKAKDGAYVRYPFSDLLGIVALESHRARCLVIGEDLGTVPEGFRERMARENILSTRVFFFERHDSKLFRRPDLYPAGALAQASTHDTPTLAGFWQGRDIEVRAWIQPDFPADAEALERENDKDRILAALGDQGLLAPGDGMADIILAIHRFLARTPSRLMLANIADVMGMVEQLNLPGTVEAHPNWRHKLPATIEELRDSEAWARTAAAVSAERG